MNTLQAERIESIKAGIVSALSLFLAFVIATLGNQLVLAKQFAALASLQVTDGLTLAVSGAIAWLSGFLFGITYRYIIRTDQNSHLQEGAVLAFGLVRGLGQVEVGLKFQQHLLWPFVLLGLESMVLFAIARFTLDWAIGHGWVRPFKGV